MKLLVSSAPHITGKDTTASLMRDLIIAMVPAMVAATYFFGFQALLLIAVSTIACVGFEALYQKMTKLSLFLTCQQQLQVSCLHLTALHLCHCGQ